MARPFEDELKWYDQPEEIIRRNGGFSGCDIDIVVRLPGTYDRRGNTLSQAVVYQLGSIQTLSYQSYNSKEAVRSLGFKNVRGYARGSRTIAGTLMFNQLYTHVLDDIGNRTILNDSKGVLTYSSGSVRYYRGAPINPAIQEAVGQDVSFQSPRILNKRHNFDFSWDQNTIGRQLKASDLPPFDIIAIFVNEYGHVGKMIIYGVDLVTEGGVLSIEDVYTEVSMQYVARDIEYFHSETQAGTVRWQGVSPFATDTVNSGKETSLVMGAMQDANERVWNALGPAMDEQARIISEDEARQTAEAERAAVADVRSAMRAARGLGGYIGVGLALERGRTVLDAEDAYLNANTLSRGGEILMGVGSGAQSSPVSGPSNISRIRSLAYAFRDADDPVYESNWRSIIGDVLRYTTIPILYSELEIEYEAGRAFWDEVAPFTRNENTPLRPNVTIYMMDYLILVDRDNTILESGG